MGETSITDRRSSLEAKLVILDGRQAGKVFLVKGETFFIGRGRNNNLCLEDRSVSRRHAVLNVIGRRFTLSDLNSLKGTHINGERIQEKELTEGDRIRIGDVVMEFRMDSASVGIISSPVGRRRVLVYPIAAILLLAMGFSLSKYVKGLGVAPKDSHGVNSEIEENYLKGLKAYNIDKDVTGAHKYWQKVIELDPNGISNEARKARVLLKKSAGQLGGPE